MECSRRRTLASVLVLLSLHCILCQNVVPTGNFLPLPLEKESFREGADMNAGLIPQRMNFFPPSNGLLPECLPRSQYLAEYQQIPDYLRPAYPKPCRSVPQTNIGPLTQDAALSIPQMNGSPQIQSPEYNALPKTNTPTPQAAPLNIKSCRIVANNPFITSPITNLSPNIEEVSSKSLIPPGLIAQGPNFNISPVMNLQVSQGTQPKISPIPKVPNLKNQIVTCTQRPLLTTTVSALNVPSAAVFPNQNTLTLPLVSNQYSPYYVQPISCSNMLTTDLTSLNFPPTLNLPISVPIESYAPISQVPVQSIVCPKSIASVDYVSNTPDSPNCQTIDLPPVFPADLPQFNDSGNPLPATEVYAPVPINLQINVPSPTIPEPIITIITAYPPPAPAPVTPDSTDVSFGSYPTYPLPPIIIEGKRSKSRSWLPLILIALIANDGGCGGSCCCSLPSSDIPIPYPIPIPTNNPIIMGSSSKSRKKGCKGKVSIKKNN